jgi:CzcA family heavy metal efflux pump
MTRWLAEHSRSIVFAFVLLIITGVGSALRLPVSLFPRIDFPRVEVSVDSGDRSIDQMVLQVTKPLEQAMRGVPYVGAIRSTTSRGSAAVSMNFPWGRDMVAATLQTEAALSAVLPELPPGTRFSVRRMDPTVFPILGLALSSTTRDPADLRTFADLTLRPLLASVPGVANAQVLGGRTREYEVQVDPAHLQALGLSIQDVVRAIGADNTVAAVGRLEDRHRLYLTLLDNRTKSVGDLGATIIKTGPTAGSGVVTLSSVATIRLGYVPEWTRVTAQGHDAVLLNIRQTPSAASVSLIKALRAKLDGFKSQIPPDIKIVTYYDQAELVTAAAGSVRDAILLGALLAGVVLFFFLRSARLMLITALLLPGVLATACLVLLALGMGFNMMTLGGMAAAVGLIVDDAVVMLEHLVRRRQEAQREGTAHAGLGAAAEMARPLIGSTLSTVVIFLPLAFLSGVTGGFFKALAVTMTASLLISLLYALFIAPLLADRWLRPKDIASAEKAEQVLRRVTRHYAALSKRVLARPALIVGAAALIFLVAGGLAYTRLGSGFMPHMDEGGFILDYKAQPGAALTDTDRLLRQVEVIIRQTPDVDSYSRRTGLQLGGGLTEPDEGDFFIHLKSGKRRPIDEVIAEISGKVQTQVPGLKIETAQLMEDLIGDLTAVPQPIEVKLYSADPAALKAAAQVIAPAISKISGVVGVVDGLRVAGDAILVTVNRPAAALEGLDADAVSRQMNDLLGGGVATQVQSGQVLIGVRVQAAADLRSRVEALGQLRLRAPDGHELPLNRIAAVTIQQGQAQVTREDLQPFLAVTARLEGRDLGSAVAAVKRAVTSLHLPGSVRVEYGGLYAEQQRSFTGLAIVFVAALFLVTFLLLYLFERWAVAASVVVILLMSTSAVFVGLWITKTELNISALMGLTMVLGIVTELAVFYFAELNLKDSPSHEALAQAGALRLRPILMSAIIAILALLPLALGLGAGSAMQTPLAIAIISGLLVGAPLVLILMPAAYQAFSGLQGKKARKG